MGRSKTKEAITNTTYNNLNYIKKQFKLYKVMRTMCVETVPLLKGQIS